MDPLVSIVMPVYNVQDYLRESLDSLVNQSYSNFEVICVDDGSTDTSMAILKEYAASDHRFHIISQQNQYAGVARNRGMSVARGKYIMFLDSDDIFEKKMLSTLVKIAQKKNTDIIFFGFTHFSSSLRRRSLMGIPFWDNKVHSPEEFGDTLFRIAQGVPWNKFFNREFVISTGLQFQNLQSNNDVFFSKAIVPEATRIMFINKRFVNYRINNSGSLQGSYKLTSGNFAKCITELYNELNDRNKYSIYKQSFENYVIDSYLLIFDRIPNRQVFNEICEIMRKSFLCMNINEKTEAITCSASHSIFEHIIKQDYDAALFSLNEYRHINCVSKKSIEYRIGKKVLSMLKVKCYE